MISTAAFRRVHTFCLSLPDTSEGTHYGDVVFRVKKKIFASCGEELGTCRIVVQLEPEHAARIVEADPRCERYTRAKDCVSMDVTDVKDWDEVRSLLLESYRLNEPTQPRSPTRKPRKKA